MEIDEKIDLCLQKLEKLERAVSKLTNLQTRFSKALHLLPVTEKEERDIQLMQRRNLEQAAKVNDDLNKMLVPQEETVEEEENVYVGILGNDYTGGV